jgi:hypothetical protein
MIRQAINIDHWAPYLPRCRLLEKYIVLHFLGIMLRILQSVQGRTRSSKFDCTKVHAVFAKKYLKQTQAIIHQTDSPPIFLSLTISNKLEHARPHPLLHRDGLCQVTREIDVQALSNCKPVGHQLERDHVQETLQAIDGLGDLNFLGLTSLEFLVVGIADNNGSASTSND